MTGRETIGVGRRIGHHSANTKAGLPKVARPMIENSERGITINKALAWTMLVSASGLIWCDLPPGNALTLM